MPPIKRRHALTLSIWLSYLLLVIYGSLVPLDFKYLPLAQAWDMFQQIPMYELGVESRADWIANGVLYVPVGFLTTYLLIHRFVDTQRSPLFFLAILFSVTVAFCVEFTQIFFPPRTVSLNDLLAESIGSLIGLLLAAKYSDWFKALLHAMLGNPRRLALHLLEAFLVGYVAFSLFPYDILLSGVELEQKFQGDNWGWLLASDPHGSIFAALKTLSETILTLPFGLFLGLRGAQQPVTYKKATLFGTLLGGCIEIAQFFTASGVSQGLSVLTRVIGVCGGLALWRRSPNWSPEKMAALMQRYTVPLGAIYLVSLLQINGWFSNHWNGADFAKAQLTELHFLPFYYHYYTTEAKALFSLASVCLMYLPIGLLTWSNRGTPAWAFFYAFISVSLIEAGKLFLLDMHPDPTNIMLGSLSAWGTVNLAQELSKAATMPFTIESETVQGTKTNENTQHCSSISIAAKPVRHWSIYIAFFLLLALVAYKAATFPTQAVLLCLFLAICAVSIWYRPALLVAIIPAALPILDLAPWSGRFFLDEFDLLVVLSLVIGYTRIPIAPRRKQHTDLLFIMATSLLALSFAISVLRGLLPWHAPDVNAFTNYYSSFNAIRITKGALWAFLLFGLFARLARAKHNVPRLFALGLLTGITGTVLVIIWERFTFPGLLNFTDVYRVTGPFSQMHTGGADIETFLTVSAPFLVFLMIDKSSFWLRAVCVLLLLGVTYGVMVTFSRVGYAGFGIALSIALASMLTATSSNKPVFLLKRALTAIVLCIALLGIATPILFGQFAQERLAQTSKDLNARRTHWADALKMRDSGWLTSLIGMGIGRYPETHFWRSEETRAAPYSLGTDAENIYFRLGSGHTMYVEQLVSVRKHNQYPVELKVRSSVPNAQLTLSLCEKWLLTSAKCSSELISFSETGSWHTVKTSISTGNIGHDSGFAIRPVKFSIYNTSPARVELDEVRISDDDGNNLLENGGFSQKLDHWFFSIDNDLPWHIWSLPIQILFDQGWLGVIAFLLFAPLGLWRACQAVWHRNAAAGIFLAAGLGFLVIGTLDSLVDSPRLLLLFLLVIWMCWNSARLPPSQVANCETGWIKGNAVGPGG